MTNSAKPRVFSGVQPSGNLTIGNYIGALKQWVQEQNTYDCFFSIVDLHAITVPQDPDSLRQKSLEVAALYIACGIDPDKATIFIQSHVAAHTELAWILTCLTPLGWLQRMTQFKDKSAKQQQDSIGAGLLIYPALMAADILLYQTQRVPVGDDQRQHLEYTRDLAQRFNHIYGDIFTIPEAMIPKAGARIMGLDTPLAKMSKSEASEGHAIYLLDKPDQVKKKVMRAVTDSGREIGFSDDPERAGVNNLLTIYQSFTGKTEAEVLADFAEARGYGDVKKAVVEVVNEALRPIQARYSELVGDVHSLNALLADGTKYADSISSSTLEGVQKRIGFSGSTKD